MFQPSTHNMLVWSIALLCTPHRLQSLLKKTYHLCSMFIINNSKVWLIETVLFEMPYGHRGAQMVCVEIVWEPLVRHMVRVTIWSSNCTVVMFFWLKFRNLCCHSALQCSMLSIHTWSTLVWELKNPAVLSPNECGSTFFGSRYFICTLHRATSSFSLSPAWHFVFLFL